MPETSLALARKYRPTMLGGLIGQHALQQTLSNAVRTGRVAQAYLFTGVRGTGKTSTARILARAVNCEAGPTTTPCGQCASCRALDSGGAIDVIEMDAASRTGVDDMRQLLESTAYSPAEARYKIYIIDEVHMLSRSAFNALLKTLEEPPAHVIFIFATTEIRKVPATIISRCQRFDLMRVDRHVLAEHFQWICDQEGVTYELPALSVIAVASEGSVRDGLSMLDQAISTGEGVVAEAATRNLLGLAEKGRSQAAVLAALEGNPGECLVRLRGLREAGADPVGILHDAMELVHNISILSLTPDVAEYLDIPSAHSDDCQAIADRLGHSLAERAWMALAGAIEQLNALPAEQVLEFALLRLAALVRAEVGSGPAAGK